jgi:hypothetical protein
MDRERRKRGTRRRARATPTCVVAEARGQTRLRFVAASSRRPRSTFDVPKVDARSVSRANHVGPIRSIRLRFERVSRFPGHLGQNFFHRMVDAIHSAFKRAKTRTTMLSRSRYSVSIHTIDDQESSIKSMFLVRRVFRRPSFCCSARDNIMDDHRCPRRHKIECRQEGVHSSLSGKR